MKRAVRGIICVIAMAIATIAGAATAQAAPAAYDIALRTCNVNNAGTDSNVQIRLAGSAGLTGWSVLDGPQDDRERGKTDHYPLTLPNVGPLFAIDLFYDHTGSSPDWCLEEITVVGPHGVTVHPHHNWLTKKIEFRIFAA